MGVIGLDGLINQTTKASDKSSGSIPGGKSKVAQNVSENYTEKVSEAEIHPSQESYNKESGDIRPNYTSDTARYISSRFSKNFMKPFKLGVKRRKQNEVATAHRVAQLQQTALRDAGGRG